MRALAQLTLNYNRVQYLLEPTDEARKAQGQQVDVCEDEAGNVQIRYRGVELAASRFDKDGRVTQGDIVGNKLLGAGPGALARLPLPG